MKYKAIIFDLFGTPVDSYSVQGYNKLLTDMASALELSVEDFSRFWRDPTYERGVGIFKTTEESIRYTKGQKKQMKELRDEFKKKTLKS